MRQVEILLNAAGSFIASGWTDEVILTDQESLNADDPLVPQRMQAARETTEEVLESYNKSETKA